MRSISRDYGYRFDIGEYFPRAVKTLCIVCISVFFLQELSRLIYGPAGWDFWIRWFGLSPYATVYGLRIWQPFTYLFLHGGILHILLNLLYLAMFGAELEHTWGARRFYIYFFVCGVGAGVIDIVVKLILDPHGIGTALIPTIGCSGAIYGILLANAVLLPHRRVWMFPLPVSVSMRIFVIIMGAIEFFGTIGATGDNISHICHLGGMLAGYIYLRRGTHLYNWRNGLSDWRQRRLRKKFQVYVRHHRDKPPSRPDNWVN
ncbi:MAG: rhomboid family intramembrane serine protease [Candidatus Acidiferrales bacterium]